MKLAYYFSALIFAACLAMQPAAAAVLVFGENVEISGPGEYSARLFATAVGQAEEIGGYNISVDASSASLTFKSVAYGAELESTLPGTEGDNPVLLQATDTNVSGVVLEENDSAVLAVLTFIVDGPGEAALTVQGGTVSGVFFDQIPASAGAPISFQVVPEPTAAGFCCLGLVGYLSRRRRA